MPHLSQSTPLQQSQHLHHPPPRLAYDDGDPIPITKILEVLDQAMPEVKFSLFEGALKKEGFFYAENVLDYKNNTDYFVSKVGIPAGSVHLFVQRVEREVGTHKCRCLNDGTAQRVDALNRPV